MAQIRTPHRPERVLPHKPCPRCHDVMLLSTIQPADDGFDLRSFRCRGCGHSEAFQSTLAQALSDDAANRSGSEDGPGHPA